MVDDDNKLQFITGATSDKKPNTCHLLKDDWDDFGFRTSFALVYINSDSEKINIGYLHIMKQGQRTGYTPMPNKYFDRLPEEYCSLGGQSYYEELMALPENIRKNILVSLQDCVFNRDIYDKNENERAMTISLLRHVTQREISLVFYSILRGKMKLTPYHFQYYLNDDEQTQIDVQVEPESTPPTNVHVLIGRNGVGKTRILSGIIDELTKTDEPAKISQKGTINFIGISDDNKEIIWTDFEHERFTNLVTVVFSAFDNFKPARNNAHRNSIPCQYVGLKTQTGDGFKSPEQLKNDFKESIVNCLAVTRRERWIKIIDILNSDPILQEYKLNELINHSDATEKIIQIFDELSSGHKIIILTITKLVELVNEKTLVIIDEPENHLHPPLLSSFIRAISYLLINRNGVALIATHSPIVLQEVPKSCVTKITRVGEQYNLSRLEIETYGENIDTLTRDVFRLELENSGFYKTINDYLQSDENTNKTFDSFMQKFDNKIGSEGRAIARSIISNSARD